MSDIAWGEPDGGLRLGVAAAGGGLELWLENVGDALLTVVSHVVSGDGEHYDWFTVTLAGGDGPPRQLRFIGDRDRSAKVRASLQPGSALTHLIDVDGWAARPINGGRPLAARGYHATATYLVEGEADAWTGRLDSRTVEVSLPA